MLLNYFDLTKKGSSVVIIVSTEKPNILHNVVKKYLKLPQFSKKVLQNRDLCS